MEGWCLLIYFSYWKSPWVAVSIKNFSPSRNGISLGLEGHCPLFLSCRATTLAVMEFGATPTAEANLSKRLWTRSWAVKPTHQQLHQFSLVSLTAFCRRNTLFQGTRFIFRALKEPTYLTQKPEGAVTAQKLGLQNRASSQDTWNVYLCRGLYK